MTKYAILHSNYNIYHAEFDNYEEAKKYYDDMVIDEGPDFDLQLCKILETHEAPEREIDAASGKLHYGIDCSPEDIEEWGYSPMFIKLRKLFGR